MAEMFEMSTWQVPFPSLKIMGPQIAFFFVFEDMFHFFGMCRLCTVSISFTSALAHQALHWGPLYKHIHKIHHKYSAPFGLAAEYAHPAEVMILGTGTIAGPLLYCFFARNLHIFTMYVWITLRLFQAVDAHSGYGMSGHVFRFASLLTRSSQISLGRCSTSYPSGPVLSTTTSTTWRS